MTTTRIATLRPFLRWVVSKPNLTVNSGQAYVDPTTVHRLEGTVTEVMRGQPRARIPTDAPIAQHNTTTDWNPGDG